jgi:hypothetical protein
VSGLASFTDDDAHRLILRSLRVIGIAVLIAAPLLWWKLGWQTAVLLMVGAAISASGLWEWQRLMTVVMERMEAAPARPPKPMGRVMVGFFLRMGVAICVLYVSLKIVDGSVYALAAGLCLGFLALTIEGIRIVRQWTA